MKTPFLLVLCLATIVMGADPPPTTADFTTPPTSGNSTSGPAPSDPTPPSDPATGNSSYIYGGPGCDSSATATNKCLPTIKDCNPFNVVLSSTEGLASVPRVKYNFCAATADSKSCCTDECGSKKDISSCLTVNPETCVWMQTGGSMGCWHKQKLCTIYTTRPDICVKIEYCYWVATNQTTQYCAFKKPWDNRCPMKTNDPNEQNITESPPLGTSQVITTDESVCDSAMPPWVVAVLVLAGLALAAGIGMITTIIIQQKIKDEEEEAKHQALTQGKM